MKMLKGLLIASWVITMVFGLLSIMGIMSHLGLLTMLATMILIVGLMAGLKE